MCQISPSPLFESFTFPYPSSTITPQLNRQSINTILADKEEKNKGNKVIIPYEIVTLLPVHSIT